MEGESDCETEIDDLSCRVEYLISGATCLITFTIMKDGESLTSPETSSSSKEIHFGGHFSSREKNLSENVLTPFRLSFL